MKGIKKQCKIEEKSDMYREIEMVHKRTKCHNSAYKDKENLKYITKTNST